MTLATTGNKTLVIDISARPAAGQWGSAVGPAPIRTPPAARTPAARRAGRVCETVRGEEEAWPSAICRCRCGCAEGGSCGGERRLPARVVSLVPARALPVVRRSLLVAGAALAAEYALRAAVGGTLSWLFSPVRSGASIARTEITEWLIIERFRRRRG